MVARKEYRLREGDVLEVYEFHDGNFGAPGMKRQKKAKPTPEQRKKWNRLEKARKCRRQLIQYFEPGDLFITWTYSVENRPPDMQKALKDFQKAIRKVKREYQKRGKELRWIRNIEKGTKGAWHIHMVVNEIGDSASIMENAWEHGTMNISKIKKHPAGEDFSKLANYLTKDEQTTEKKKDGTESQPRIKEANYGTSRNMPVPEATKKPLKRWREEPYVKKGYYLADHFQGTNQMNGFLYRRYILIRIGGNNDGGYKYLC